MNNVLFLTIENCSSHFFSEIPFLICSLWVSLCWFVVLLSVFVSLCGVVCNTKKGNLAFRAGACRKDLGRCRHLGWPQGVVLPILFGDERSDEVEMPQVLHEHPVRVHGKYRQAVSAKAGVCSLGSSSSSGGEN